MATLPYFPRLLMRENAVTWEIAGASVGPGRSLSGQVPTALLDGGGLVICVMSDIPLTTPDQVRSWRALTGIADSRAQAIVVPMDDRKFFPAPLVGGVALRTLPLVPHSDDSTFSDGSMYRSDVVEASLVGAGSLRQTAITIRFATGGPTLGGEHFSIDHDTLRWRLYRILTSIDNGDGTCDVTISPPLRGDVPDGTPLQFDQPKCVMKIAQPGAMNLALTLRRHGKPSVSFVEAFPPFS